MIRKPFRRSLLTLAVLAVALPAAAQRSRSRDTTELRLPHVADSAALVQALRELPSAPAGPLPAYMIRYDSTGARSAVGGVFEGSAELDSAVVGVLRRLLAERLTPARRGWLMLQVATGADASVGAYPGRSREDEPRVTNAGDVSKGQQRIFDRYIDLLPGRRAAVIVRMRVEFDGTVSDAMVVSSSGVAGVDRDILELARAITFRPGRIDGRAVRTWVTLPLNLQPPAAPFGRPAG